MAEMRKIETAETAEARRKRNRTLMSLLMLGVMVFSTFAFGYFYFGGEEEETGSKGVQNIGDEWVVQFGENYLRFRNSPESVKNITIDNDIKLEDYYAKTVYLAAEKEWAKYEIGVNLGRYVERMQEVCYGKCEENLPEKNCTDILIVFNESIDNKIYKQDNCVFIEGDLRAIDAFLYRIFGINE